MLDLNRLRVFRSVVASGSIQAAASNLGYTPSAVSQQISALQRETGLVLFEKQGRGIAPTAAATELVKQTTDLMGQLGRIEDLVGDLREGRTKSLSVGYFASAGSIWMPRLASQLAAEMPDLTLDLRITDGVFTGALPDINLEIHLPGELEREGFELNPLMDDPYFAAVHRSHRLARRDTASWAELIDETLIRNDLPQNPCMRIATSAFEAAGFTPRYPINAQDHYTALAFVAADLGVSVLPGLCVIDVPKDVRIVRMTDPSAVRRISAMKRVSAAPNAAADRAIEILTDLALEHES